MAFTKKTEVTEKSSGATVYSVNVKRARVVKDGLCFFDMNVNGIDIYGCIARDYKNAKGEEGTLITLPQYKGTDKDGKDIIKDGKPVYYSHCFFPISKELKAEILRQIESLIG